MLRRTRVLLSSVAIAAIPTLGALLGASAAAAPVAAPAHLTTITSADKELAVTHGPRGVNNGGVAVKIGKSAHGGTLNLNTSATSTNWSGYALDGGTYTSVTASWTQPTGSCSGSSATYSSFWVGLDGYSSNSVEQDGTDTDCSSGTPQYYGWYEMYPKPSYYFGSTVKPGDSMSASVTYTSTNTYKLVLTDSTQGWTTSTTKKLSGAPRSSAEVIIEAPSSSSGVLPLADFGTVNFSGSTVGGTSLGSQNPIGITMVNNSGADKDSISSINSSGGFSGTWDSSN